MSLCINVTLNEKLNLTISWSPFESSPISRVSPLRQSQWLISWWKHWPVNDQILLKQLGSVTVIVHLAHHPHIMSIVQETPPQKYFSPWLFIPHGTVSSCSRKRKKQNYLCFIYSKTWRAATQSENFRGFEQLNSGWNRYETNNLGFQNLKITSNYEF